MPDYCDARELDELRDKLLWRGPQPSSERFLSVFMDQNNKCNLRCRMCGFSDPCVASLPGYDLPRWLYDRIRGRGLSARELSLPVAHDRAVHDARFS